MTTVLNSPMTSDRMGKLLHLDGQTADEVTHVAGLFTVADRPEICDPDRKQSLPVNEPRQAFGSGHLNIGSPLDPAMFLFPCVQTTSTNPAKVSLRLFVDIFDGCVVQRSLVTLQRQHVVSSLIDDLLGDGRLCPHRVDRDDGSLDIDKRQECGNRRDFVRFLRRCHLRQRQAKLARPNTDGMQGPQTPAAIVASPQRLAVDGQYRLLHTHRLRGRGTQRRQPHRKAGLKGIWPQGDQNSPEDIFLGNPMRKIQQFQQDVSLQLGPCSNGRWSIGSSKAPPTCAPFRQPLDAHRGTANGRVYLVTTDPVIAKKYDMHDEREF